MPRQWLGKRWVTVNRAPADQAFFGSAFFTAGLRLAAGLRAAAGLRGLAGFERALGGNRSKVSRLLRPTSSASAHNADPLSAASLPRASSFSLPALANARAFLGLRNAAAAPTRAAATTS